MTYINLLHTAIKSIKSRCGLYKSFIMNIILLSTLACTTIPLMACRTSEVCTTPKSSTTVDASKCNMFLPTGEYVIGVPYTAPISSSSVFLSQYGYPNLYAHTVSESYGGVIPLYGLCGKLSLSNKVTAEMSEAGNYISIEVGSYDNRSNDYTGRLYGIIR